MKYYYIEPEVAGEFGERTIIDRSSGKMIVLKLNYEFDETPPADDLLESVPCFIASEKMVNEIKVAKLNGLWFDNVEITTSKQFKEIYPNYELPNFLWLRIDGKVAQDDFGIDSELRLVVSERALAVLKAVGISHAEITPFEG